MHYKLLNKFNYHFSYNSIIIPFPFHLTYYFIQLLFPQKILN